MSRRAKPVKKRYMKTMILSLAVSSMIFVACNNKGSNESVSEKTEPIAAEGQASTNNIPASEILTAYLKLKNALTNDNDKEAAAAGTDLVKAFKEVDKTKLNAEQVRIFTDVEADAIEHAEHIASNAGNLVHQREHFETLSADVYDLVKVTGAGKTMYYTHCPMYNNNKGANWLSETKEVKNPYLGQAMLTCGTVNEELN